MACATATPPGIDAEITTAARIYDYWLGGLDNFAADRIVASAVTQAAPEASQLAIENREFLRRGVRYLAAEAGIAQFLDQCDDAVVGCAAEHCRFLLPVTAYRRPMRPRQPRRPPGYASRPSRTPTWHHLKG